MQSYPTLIAFSTQSNGQIHKKKYIERLLLYHFTKHFYLGYGDKSADKIKIRCIRLFYWVKIVDILGILLAYHCYHRYAQTEKKIELK